MENGTVTSWRYKSNVAKRVETHLDGGAMFGLCRKCFGHVNINITNKSYSLRTDPLLLQTKDGNMLIDSGMGNGKLDER